MLTLIEKAALAISDARSGRGEHATTEACIADARAALLALATDEDPLAPGHHINLHIRNLLRDIAEERS